MQGLARFLVIVLFCQAFLLAKSSQSCYSVQLKSFVFKESSTYDFASHGYEESCRLISFTNINAVRCGCFENFNEAKKASRKFSSSYPEAKIVTTYKYRFTENKNVLKAQEAQEVEEIQNAKEVIKAPQKLIVEQNVQTKPLEEVINAAPQERENIFNHMSFQGNVTLVSQAYLLAPKNKNLQNFTASTELELAYTQDDTQVLAKLTAQQDSYDFAKSDEANKRSFVRLDELYFKHNFEDAQMSFGKNIEFWGALEVRNLTDTFNSDELRADPFYKEKLGVWNAAFTHYTESGELSARVKLYEQERKIAAFPYVYYYFPSTLYSPVLASEIPLVYTEDLQTQESRYRPSIYLKYSATADFGYALDYGVIFENGYDSQRYYTQSLAPDGSYVQTNENAYLVNKLSTFNTLVLGSTLYKLEAVYADVLSDAVVGDYLHFGLGLEHTFGDFYEGADLGLIAEYYNYSVLEEGKRNDLELFELFENDLFLGSRYSFNEGNDASIVGGIIFDLDYEEEVYYLEYETRIADIFKLNFDYRYIEPSKHHLTAFNLMGRHQRVSLKAGYYF